MAFTVYPSENDIAAVADEGRIGTEISHKDYAKNWIKNYVLSGFTLPATTSATLVIPVASGSCFIEGRRVQSNASENETLAANDTNHIFVTLSLDGNNLVDAVNITSNTSGSLPANSVKIGRAITDATEVTSTFDDRDTSPIIDASVHGGGLNILLAHKTNSGVFNIPAAAALIPGLTVTIPAGSFFGRAAPHRAPSTPHLLIEAMGYLDLLGTGAVSTFTIRVNGTIVRTSKAEIAGTPSEAVVALNAMVGAAPFVVFDPDISNTIEVFAAGTLNQVNAQDFTLNIWDTGDGPRF